MKASTAAATGAVLALVCRPAMPTRELRRLWWTLTLSPQGPATETALVGICHRAAGAHRKDLQP